MSGGSRRAAPAGDACRTALMLPNSFGTTHAEYAEHRVAGRFLLHWLTPFRPGLVPALAVTLLVLLLPEIDPAALPVVSGVTPVASRSVLF